MRAEKQMFLLGNAILSFALMGCSDTQERNSVKTQRPEMEEAKETFTVSVPKFLQLFEGELTRVDPAAKTFAVKSPEEHEMEFLYNDQTQISGTEGAVEALARQSRTPVRVYFDEASMTATKIEVRQPQ